MLSTNDNAINALIYSAGFDGHRQVYVYVLSHILKENGFNVFVGGNFKEKILDSSYIDKIKKDKSIELIDTSSYRGNGLEITLKEFVQLQDKHSINLTIFTFADHHIELFTSQIGNHKLKLRGRNVGIFLRPFYFYDHFTLLDKLRYIKRLKGNWRSNVRLFHEVLLNRFKLLDKSCHIDEKFVSHHKKAVWLPDVFQQYAETLIKKDEYPDEQRWIDILDSFKLNNKDRFIFLYFGSAQPRRGYDLLLKMAVDYNGCFVHCGLNNEKENYAFKVDELKAILSKEGRILETNQYITDPNCIEHFFKSVTHLVLPYRNFMGSSGVMLQALGYHIPVLVPDKGIIGYRVKHHNLGMVFGSESDTLYTQFDKFIQIPKESYYDTIEKYMNFQSESQLRHVLTHVCNNSEFTIELP